MTIEDAFPTDADDEEIMRIYLAGMEPSQTRDFQPRAYCKMDRGSLLVAVSSLLDPTIDNNRRNECFMVAEDYKTKRFHFHDTDFLCNPSQPSVIVLFGLQCLDHYLKHQWGHIDVHTKHLLKQNIFQLAQGIHNYRFSKKKCELSA
ncbi:unnamed protein product [Heterobilharzia americana]|nr:unnamed protein product [Heterobilharzia americana]